MGNWKAFISSYITKFYGGEKNDYRSNKYLIVNKRGEDFDHNGYLGSYRKVHAWKEVSTLADAKAFLAQYIAKSEQKNWVIYKVYESPKDNGSKPRPSKGKEK